MTQQHLSDCETAKPSSNWARIQLARTEQLKEKRDKCIFLLLAHSFASCSGEPVSTLTGLEAETRHREFAGIETQQERNTTRGRWHNRLVCGYVQTHVQAR